MQLRISRIDYCTRSRGSISLNGFMAFGMIYWLIPRMTKDLFFLNWQISTLIGTLELSFIRSLCYVGFLQASMWKQFNPDGTLTYGNFLETVTQIMPMY
jgi:cytochrome c oxidase cbb3-type subunit I/II